MPGGRLARWGLLAVVLLAALVRVGYVVAAKRNDQPAGDAIFYSLEATELVHGHGFVEPFKSTPAADHPPLIALSLAPAAWLFDDSVYAMRFTNVVLGTLTVLGIALLARRLVGHTAGIAAGAIAALYPGLWINDGLLMGETLAALATVGVLLGALELRRRGSWGLALLCGLLVGLAGLVRAELLLLWVVAVVPAVFARGTRRRLRLGRLALSLLAVVITLLPWTVYNATRFHNVVVLSTNDGLTIAGANCPSSYYDGGVGFWSYDCATANQPPGDQSQVASVLRRRGFDYATAHLSRVPVVVAARLARAWSLSGFRGMVALNQGEGRERWASWLALYGFWFITPLGVIGARRLRERGESVLPFVLLAAQVTLVASAFYGIVRFRVPFEVGLVVLAGIAFTTPKTSAYGRSSWSRGAAALRRRSATAAPRPTSAGNAATSTSIASVSAARICA